MTSPESPSRLTAEFLAFYGEDEGRNGSGYTLEQILAWDNEDWEHQHDFVQWLFATDEPSMFNADAPVLDAATIATFRADAMMRRRLRKAFDRWLIFCGIVRFEGELVFDDPNPDVWAGQNHNWLRITRVLRSLNLLGLEDDAKLFFVLLTTIKGLIDPKTWDYWERAAKPV
jgi:Opioid growth factor receptor (OGFr) conserved region